MDKLLRGGLGEILLRMGEISLLKGEKSLAWVCALAFGSFSLGFLIILMDFHQISQHSDRFLSDFLTF